MRRWRARTYRQTHIQAQPQVPLQLGWHVLLANVGAFAVAAAVLMGLLAVVCGIRGGFHGVAQQLPSVGKASVDVLLSRSTFPPSLWLSAAAGLSGSAWTWAASAFGPSHPLLSTLALGLLSTLAWLWAS